MEQLDDVPQQPGVVALLARDLNDSGDALIIHVGPEDRIGVVAALAERHLHDDGILVAIDHRLLVLPPSERAVDEEVSLRGAFLRIARHKLAGVDDQMLAAFEVDAVLLEPLFEPGRPREDPDSFALLQPVAGLGAHQPRVAIKAVLANRGGGDPKLSHSNAVVALVERGMLQPKELAEALAVIVVKMGDADGVVVVAVGLGEVAFELTREIAAEITLVIGAPHVGIVDEHLALVGQIDA